MRKYVDDFRTVVYKHHSGTVQCMYRNGVLVDIMTIPNDKKIYAYFTFLSKVITELQKENIDALGDHIEAFVADTDRVLEAIPDFNEFIRQGSLKDLEAMLNRYEKEGRFEHCAQIKREIQRKKERKSDS
jgi:hypothetical protein